MRNQSLNPSSANVIDKMLGGTFKYVKIVAENIKAIQYIAMNLTAVINRQTQVALTVVADASWTTADSATVALPTGMDHTKVISASAVLVGTDGSRMVLSSFLTVRSEWVDIDLAVLKTVAPSLVANITGKTVNIYLTSDMGA